MSRGTVLSQMEHFAHPARTVGALGVVPGMTIVDFGAGSGAYVLAFAEALSGSGRVIAVDVQKDLLRRISNEAIKKGYMNVEVVWSDLEESHASKRDDHSADLILISNILFQVRDKKAVVREAIRICKPNGRIVIIDWSESFGGLGPIEDHVFSEKSARILCEELDLSLVKNFSPGVHHYGLIYSI